VPGYLDKQRYLIYKRTGVQYQFQKILQIKTTTGNNANCTIKKQSIFAAIMFFYAIICSTILIAIIIISFHNNILSNLLPNEKMQAGQ